MNMSEMETSQPGNFGASIKERFQRLQHLYPNFKKYSFALKIYNYKFPFKSNHNENSMHTQFLYCNIR